MPGVEGRADEKSLLLMVTRFVLWVMKIYEN